MSYNGDKDPPWKTRLENKVKDFRKNLSRLEESKRSKYKVHEYLKKKYKPDKKCISQVKEELVRNIIAITAKIKRYTERMKQYYQNKLFENNQYQEMNKKEEIKVIPEKESTKEFWKNILGNSVKQNFTLEGPWSRWSAGILDHSFLCTI